jgi:threonine/homoserine/homoserine lactone efflux protein
MSDTQGFGHRSKLSQPYAFPFQISVFSQAIGPTANILTLESSYTAVIAALRFVSCLKKKNRGKIS